MSGNGRVIWALWGALSAVAALVLVLLVSGGQAPALGDTLDLDDPRPAVSLTSGPEPTEGPSPTTPTPTTPRTEVVTPSYEPPVRVPVPDDDDDDDDDDD